jgi:mono/diheme cytochrome c family protein
MVFGLQFFCRMKGIAMTKLTIVIPLLIAGCGLVWSQQRPEGDKTMSESAMSGQELYRVYCAACHGTDGKGNGPVAPALKARVPDLTLLAKNSKGKFPLLRVEQAIDGEEGIPAVHGTREMPVYYELFEGIRRDTAFVAQRIGLLTGYIQSIQQK